MNDEAAPTQALSAREIAAALVRMGVVAPGERLVTRPLAGGVSSDISLVELSGGRRYCVKRALPRLKVADLWEAPIARNHYEWAWFRTVERICPEAVPPLVGEDAEAGLFVMGYLDPLSHPLWKEELHRGQADPDFAAEVGARLARIHGATAGEPEVAGAFATDENFWAIRLEPYLLATARRHPDCAAALEALAAATAATRLALVHGDVSPKNILVGRDGPVFLDAECAWYGDPAFDLAFCLNHLLLKCLWTPGAEAGFLACFDRFAATYLAAVAWEPRAAIEARAARLLPGLFLARIDGKSPVEYVTGERDKARVRHVARHFLAAPAEGLAAIRDAWAAEIGS
ncbi:MAG TPA: aminoglycoside phosphotransferase family protein [Stellaceae bacterium]|nr:aminoglycoside phosphotransferase family protein [Stellaceae bacterium]